MYNTNCQIKYKNVNTQVQICMHVCTYVQYII